MKSVGSQVFGFAEQNVNAAFDLAHKLVQAKDPQEAFTLQSEFLKTQLANLQAQAKEIGVTIQKSATGEQVDRAPSTSPTLTFEGDRVWPWPQEDRLRHRARRRSATPLAPVADRDRGGRQGAEASATPLNELQGNVRAVVEKGLVETRNAYAKAKSNADEAAGALETSYAAAKAGVVAINAKALEALRANVEANFDFMKSAIAAKNVADYVALQGEFARKRLEAMTDQTKEIGELAQKLAVDTAEPIKAQVAKSLQRSLALICHTFGRAVPWGRRIFVRGRSPGFLGRALATAGFDTSFPPRRPGRHSSVG